MARGHPSTQAGAAGGRHLQSAGPDTRPLFFLHLKSGNRAPGQSGGAPKLLSLLMARAQQVCDWERPPASPRTYLPLGRGPGSESAGSRGFSSLRPALHNAAWIPQLPFRNAPGRAWPQPLCSPHHPLPEELQAGPRERLNRSLRSGGGGGRGDVCRSWLWVSDAVGSAPRFPPAPPLPQPAGRGLTLTTSMAFPQGGAILELHPSLHSGMQGLRPLEAGAGEGPFFLVLTSLSS